MDTKLLREYAQAYQSGLYEGEDEIMIIRVYTEEEIREALSEVGVGAGDTNEAMCYLSRLPSALVIETDEVLKQPELKIELYIDDDILREYLLAEYDRLHDGKPGSARKIIEEAPSEEPTRCKHCKYFAIVKNQIVEEVKSAKKTGKWMFSPDDAEGVCKEEEEK